MNWIATTFIWYTFLLALGLIFYPLTRRLFAFFFDHGYPFSKTIGILLISYTSYLLGTLNIIRFNQFTIYIILAGLILVNMYFLWKDKLRKTIFLIPKSKALYFIIEELLFLVALFFLTYIRGQEPSIHDLEKFMDFGFINSILHSVHFPPLDMWYSAGPNVHGVQHPQGFPINYYYFGHLTGAVLIKLTGVSPYIGYNLILATIFAQGVTLTFSLVANIVMIAEGKIKKHTPFLKIICYGLLGSILLNLAGNFHTIYLFTKGYPNESAIPFWKILGHFNPAAYWYPNATRFIPFTIHEFPSYSYVVADLHGHVLDIPFVLLTLAVLLHLFYTKHIFIKEVLEKKGTKKLKKNWLLPSILLSNILSNKYLLFSNDSVVSVFLGFMLAVHYMTNAFDGGIYLLLSLIVFLIVYKLTSKFIIQIVLLIVFFLIFSFPFTSHFSLFVSGIGVNCVPKSFFDHTPKVNGVVKTKLGPFLFEKGNCQKSPFWMLFILWGFFWTNMIFLMMFQIRKFKNISCFQRILRYAHIVKLKKNQSQKREKKQIDFSSKIIMDKFMLLLFIFGTALIIIPEFFYVKDIYDHDFRANTMFKLGYQAYIIMSLASIYVIYRLKQMTYSQQSYVNFFIGEIVLQYITVVLFPVTLRHTHIGFFIEWLFLIPFLTLIYFLIIFYKQWIIIVGFIGIYLVTNAVSLILLYPLMAFPFYYHNITLSSHIKQIRNIHTDIDGSSWLKIQNNEAFEIINFINLHIKNQSVILEAQGDSYTDLNVISAYTGNPTLAGWWVHEWLWRGSADVVGKRITDINAIYQSSDLKLTKSLIKKYHIQYVVVSPVERKKYSEIDESKFNKLGKKMFETKSKFGALYQIK